MTTMPTICPNIGRSIGSVSDIVCPLLRRGFRSSCTALTPSQTLPHQGGGPVSALLFVLPPPRWGGGRGGVMRAECVDSVENRSLIDESGAAVSAGARL